MYNMILVGSSSSSYGYKIMICMTQKVQHAIGTYYMGAMGAIAPKAKKLWSDALKSNFVMSFFETVKCTLKIRIYHYARGQSFADFSLKMHQKRFARPPDFARTRWGSLQCSPDLRAGFKSRDRDTERNGENRRG